MSDQDDYKLKQVVDQIRLLADNLDELRIELAVLRMNSRANNENDNGNARPPNRLQHYKNKIKDLLLLRNCNFASDTICVSRGDYLIRPGDPNDEKTLPCRPSACNLTRVTDKLGYLKSLLSRKKCEARDQGCEKYSKQLSEQGKPIELPNGNESRFMLDVTCKSESQFGAGSSSWGGWPTDHLNDYSKEDDTRSQSEFKKSIMTNCTFVQTEPFYVILKMGGTCGVVSYTKDRGMFNCSKTKIQRAKSNSKLRLTKNKLTVVNKCKCGDNCPYLKNRPCNVFDPHCRKEKWREKEKFHREIRHHGSNDAIRPVCRKETSADSSISVDLEVTVSKDYDLSNNYKGFRVYNQGYNHNWFNRLKDDTICIEQQPSDGSLSKNYPFRRRNSICDSKTSVTTSTADLPECNYCGRSRKTSKRYKENVQTQTCFKEFPYCVQTSYSLEKDLENIFNNHCTEINSVVYGHSHL